MKNSTPNSALDRLHDYYQPTPPAWTPQTIGWGVLFGLFFLLFLWFAIHTARNWLANRYRRQALRELEIATPDQFSPLLKRVALATWPREKIASLTGEAWLQFLGATDTTESFQSPPGNRIEEFAICLNPAPIEDEHLLKTIVAEWIRRHRVQA